MLSFEKYTDELDFATIGQSSGITKKPLSITGFLGRCFFVFGPGIIESMFLKRFVVFELDYWLYFLNQFKVARRR